MAQQANISAPHGPEVSQEKLKEQFTVKDAFYWINNSQS